MSAWWSSSQCELSLVWSIGGSSWRLGLHLHGRLWWGRLVAESSVLLLVAQLQLGLRVGSDHGLLLLLLLDHLLVSHDLLLELHLLLHLGMHLWVVVLI